MYIASMYMSKQEDLIPSHIISHRIPYELLVKVEQFEKNQHMTNRTEAMNTMLTICDIVMRNFEKIKDPELVEELKGQLAEGGLVDYIKHMNSSQFTVLHSIVLNEMKQRNRKLK